MGRFYREELEELRTIVGPSMERKKLLRRAVFASSDKPLLLIASGGAQVAARFLSYLHIRAFGQPVTVMTPLEAVNSGDARGAAIWLVSQGGAHADILMAARWATVCRPLESFALIGRDRSPLAELVDGHGGLSASLGTSPEADGFLSTNGLWAMLLAIADSYAPYFDKEASGSFDAYTASEEVLNWSEAEVARIPSYVLRQELAVITDPWAQLGALDLQVRATEASLANVWTADYRNLGHGRHFWLADRAETTLGVFLSSDEFLDLDSWTRRDLPEGLETVVVTIPFGGIKAALASVAWSMHFTQRLASMVDRDPGRPGVPPFGERLYGGSVAYANERDASNASDSALAAKLGLARGSRLPPGHNLGDALLRYKESLQGRSIRAMVFDFDGTLVFSHHRWGSIPGPVTAQLRRLSEAGIILGIATGRGDSIQPVLKSALGCVDLTRVVVGYHHGSHVCALSADVAGLDDECGDPALKRAHELIRSTISHAATSDLRQRQCTLRSANGVALKDIWLLTRAVLDSDPLTKSLNAWVSSHSIDICATEHSKCNVIRHLEEHYGIGPGEVLRFGDRGAWPGNDFELLDHPNGISVDTCSMSLDRCWNLTSHIGPGPVGIERLLRSAVPMGAGVVKLDLEALE